MSGLLTGPLIICKGVAEGVALVFRVRFSVDDLPVAIVREEGVGLLGCVVDLRQA